MPHSFSARGTKECTLSGREEGFALVEAVVSMVLLMIVLLSVLPVLTQSFFQTTKDAELVTASSLATQAIEHELAQKTCAGLTALDQSTSAPPAASLRTVRTVRTIGACPVHFPGTVRVEVVVTDSATSEVEISAATLVLVTGP